MAPIQIKIPGQLLVPFGGPKWSIEQISVVGVSTSGTYVQSETPLAHIDKARARALRLRDFKETVPGDWDGAIEILETRPALDKIQKHLRERCDLATDSERRFLDLYFEYCRQAVALPRFLANSYPERSESPTPWNDEEWVFDALLPLPQAHLYHSDPLQDDFQFVPKKMMKVDFAFWTGKHFIAVEIDGSSHAGNEDHVRKDRLLQRAGVQVVHILNSEILKHGIKVIERLLPSEITKFWRSAEESYRCNPFGDVQIPF